MGVLILKRSELAPPAANLVGWPDVSLLVEINLVTNQPFHGPTGLKYQSISTTGFYIAKHQFKYKVFADIGQLKLPK
jgi:hypothetical protein